MTATTDKFVSLGGDISLTVDGGTYNKVVVAGDRINVTSGRAFYYRDATVSLTINDGTFNSYVAAGLLYQGTNTKASAEVENTKLTINGGSFAKDVYGGNFGNNKEGAANGAVTGKSTVTLDVSKASITIDGGLFVGSYGAGVVGSTELILKGASATNTITATDIWGGCSSDSVKEENNVRTYKTSVVGDRTLTFTGFDSSINATRILGFKTVNVDKDTEAMIENSVVRLDDVSVWNFAGGLNDEEKFVGGSILGGFYNDFTGDTLTLTGYESMKAGDTWDLFGTCNADINSFKTVTGFDKGTDEWTLTTTELKYTLAIDEGALRLSAASIAAPALS